MKLTQDEMDHLSKIHSSMTYVRKDVDGQAQVQPGWPEADIELILDMESRGLLDFGFISNVPRRVEVAPSAWEDYLTQNENSADGDGDGDGLLTLVSVPMELDDSEEDADQQVIEEKLALPETVKMDPAWSTFTLGEFAQKVAKSLVDWGSDTEELLPGIYDYDYDLTIGKFAALLAQADPDSTPVVLSNASDPFTVGSVRGLRDETDWDKGDGSEVVLVAGPGPNKAGDLSGLVAAAGQGIQHREAIDLHVARQDYERDKVYLAHKGEPFDQPQPWSQRESNLRKTVFFVASTEDYPSYFPAAHFFEDGVLYVVAMEVD